MVDEYFCETFSTLFYTPEKIMNKSIRKVNKETGFLELFE